LKFAFPHSKIEVSNKQNTAALKFLWLHIYLIQNIGSIFSSSNIDGEETDGQVKWLSRALAAASGVSDTAVLDSLINSGIGPDTIASVSLIPLVAVAWADRKMEAKEREAILKAATEAGIEASSASYSIMEKWLDEQPDDQLLGAWTEYVSAMKSTLDEAAVNQLKSSIVSRAQTVAEAAGGILGLGNKVSDAERNLLAKLEEAFA